MADLTQTLTRLLNDARHNPGSGIRNDLARGLRVHARIRGQKLTLAISRQAPTKPSTQEWQTVLPHLPQVFPDPGAPVLTEANGRWYLGATWPVDELIKIGGA